MQRVYRWIWQAILFVCLAILTLNIEDVANKLGVGTVLSANASLGARVMMTILNVLRSPPALYAALFFAGGGAFAWGLALLKGYENRPGGPSVADVAYRCKDAVLCLDGYGVNKHLVNVPRHLDRTNEALRIFNIAEVEITNLNNKEDRKQASARFQVLAGLLERRDLENAAIVSKAMALRETQVPEAGA